MSETTPLARFLAEIVLTSHYLAEPPSKADQAVSDAEMRCLNVIAEHGPIVMSQVAEMLHASKPRVTQLVALLEANGLVERNVASDRRRIEVKTSAQGRRAIAKLELRYRALAAAIEAELGAADARELTRLLAAITPLSRLTEQPNPLNG